MDIVSLGKRWLPNKPEASSTDKGRLASFPHFFSLHAEIFILEHFDLGRKKDLKGNELSFPLPHWIQTGSLKRLQNRNPEMSCPPVLWCALTHHTGSSSELNTRCLSWRGLTGSHCCHGSVLQVSLVGTGRPHCC